MRGAKVTGWVQERREGCESDLSGYGNDVDGGGNDVGGRGNGGRRICYTAGGFPMRGQLGRDTSNGTILHPCA